MHEARGARLRIAKLLDLKRKYEGVISQSKNASARLNKLVDKLMSAPLTTIPQTAKELAISFPTAQSDIQKLMSLGILVESERETKPKRYIAREFFDAAYVDDTG